MGLAECRRIGVPATMVYGRGTTAVDRRTTELLREAVRGARQIVIDGAGHMSPLTHPDAVAAVIQNHLRWAEDRTG
ncbi:MAG: alpha/beta hydrolase [Rhodospirillales bacterium]|nr:MAG: alpha/beta hydrolase [Rhodospirillales bacterium]